MQPIGSVGRLQNVPCTPLFRNQRDMQGHPQDHVNKVQTGACVSLSNSFHKYYSKCACEQCTSAHYSIIRTDKDAVPTNLPCTYDTLRMGRDKTNLSIGRSVYPRCAAATVVCCGRYTGSRWSASPNGTCCCTCCCNPVTRWHYKLLTEVSSRCYTVGHLQIDAST